MMLFRRSSYNWPRQRRWLLGVTLLTSIWLPLSSLWQSGHAQNFTDEEIGSYAMAVLAIEEIRIQAYEDVSDLMTIAKEDVTRHDLRCFNADGLNLKTLPRTVRSQVRRLVINYCNDAKQIVENSGLTTEKFNVITKNHRDDQALAEQIQSEIARQL
ncbi:DUF4168 domain-containing protein [Leptothoe kymatousa]|uniref:DUF4168 domain-containing protein n=1 Tax=Leptothoe kymatousa TAU-MAC 1615 TaxID=2364775 RepID=A0ABS5Y5D3_9CYAN|nr:DUF4168 domain-containing protein [Leptothoe kymatousa]MBT9312190.1 DUF4168 domain-containing protein [Leptothoe kymatousa TAU-MAC 1615]